MQPKLYSGIVTVTLVFYILYTIFDFASSIWLFNMGGFTELNPLYQFFNGSYWALYWAISIGFPVLLLEFGNRWAFVYMWAPTIVHALCVINNLNLIRGG